MRSMLLAVSLVALTTCGPSTSMPTPVVAPNPLEGTWELVSAKETIGDSVVYDMKAPQLRSIKVINATHFSYLTLGPSGEFVRAAAGHYTASNGLYTEQIEYSSGRRLAEAYPFTYRVEGNLWYHKSIGGTRESFDEVWRRVR
ncbi:MAG: hypothetical protein HOQ09_09505 [Gemmatimonadaceae bacterium]|nr:hypothetical protein [Gemmatimonadaceae bacterium]